MIKHNKEDHVMKEHDTHLINNPDPMADCTEDM